jgi:hypothetical protein
LIVDRIETRELDDAVERSARVRFAEREARLAVAVPPELAGDPEDASPFVPVALLPAMVCGEDLHVDAPVSPRLVRGATRAAELYGAWAPPLREATIEAAEEREARGSGSEIACFFSRGVDSTYSAAVPRTYPGPLSRLIFINGFELTHDRSVRAEEIRRARVTAERIGLPLTVASASFHDLTTQVIGDSDDNTIAGLAMVGLASAGALGTVVVPSGDSTVTLGPYGSSPVIDPLFSTEGVRIEHDSVALGRVRKGLWIAHERPDLLRQLKVCFNENRPDNCGRCAKCLLTMGTLIAAGRLAEASQFPDEIDAELVRATRPKAFQSRIEWAELARALEDGQDDDLREAILEALAAPRAPYPGPPPREDTPDFRRRHNSLLVATMRDGKPWPPAEPFAGPTGVGIVRALDPAGARHVYGIGHVPPGTLVGELGAAPRDPALDLEPLRLTAAGYLTTGAVTVERPARSWLGALRWVAAPLTWRDVSEPAGVRIRAALWRLRRLFDPPPARSAAEATVAYLHRHPAPVRLPLHSAIHPFTGDQLLTTNPAEPGDLGYGAPVLLGYLDAAAPLTGRPELALPRLVWAARFGQKVRAGR